MLIAMNDYQKKILASWLAASLLPLVVFLLYFFLRSDYTLRGYGDALLVSGAVVIVIPLFALIGRSGVFDVVAYSFYRLGESFRKGTVKRYDTAYDYKLHKKEKRSQSKPYFLPFYIVGGALLAIGIILSLVFDSWH